MALLKRKASQKNFTGHTFWSLIVAHSFYHVYAGHVIEPPMTEADLKQTLVKLLRSRAPHFVVFRHEDVSIAGVPDMSVTGYGVTTWWECKHATPYVRSSDLQEIRMRQLAGAGFAARYIIWSERKDIKRTLIVHPRFFEEWETHYEREWPGFNHRAVVDYLIDLHKPL